MSTELKQDKGPLGALALKRKLGAFLLQGLVVSAFMHASVMTIVGLWPDSPKQSNAGTAYSDSVVIIPRRPNNPVIPPRPITPPPKPDLALYTPVEEEPAEFEEKLDTTVIPDFYGDLGIDIGDGDADGGVVGVSPIDSPNTAGFNDDIPIFSIFEIAPVPLDVNPQPAYPPLALKAGVEGKVWIWVHVGAKGEVLGWQLTDVRPPNLGFEEEVARVIPQWKFTPAIQQGNPVAVWVVLPFKFKLE